MADHHEAILDRFRQAGALLEGHFLLSSGRHSPAYLQCALVLQRPDLAEDLCRRLARAFADDGVVTVLAPAIGGIVVAHEVARALGARAVFAEREGGRMTLRRGFALGRGERVLCVEDVVTTGGSLREVQQLARADGADVVAVAALVDRTGGADPGFGMPLTALVEIEAPTYVPEDCPQCRRGLPLVKPGSRDI
ncbi:MAG: orotate phosphoribosyltransferase [Phycisphaerae bacterium]